MNYDPYPAFCLNLEGVRPSMYLKVLQKCWQSQKPVSSAISVMHTDVKLKSL